MIDWQHQRHPEDVPTPVAVAVSDFCRRARAPAPPAVIRDALARLAEAADPAVRALADGEPPATPLGPLAVVDIIGCGTDPATAAQRQQSGYYDMVRDLARPDVERKQELEPVPPAAKPSAPRPAKEPKAPKKPSKVQSVAARIAPVRRSAEPVARAVPPPAVYGTSFLPKRNLPVPRGRFTRIDTSRAPYEALLRPESKDLIASLVEQRPHRIALLRSLDQGYGGRKGAPLSVDDVLNVLDRHLLVKALSRKEHEVVLEAVKDARGSIGKAAHALGMKDAELDSLIDALELSRAVHELREGFTREALSPRNLGQRLELLTRRRYLEDLGIEDKFREVLERDLKKLISAVKDAVGSVHELVELLSRQHALDSEALRKAFEELGLAQTFLTTPTP
jgi:hypothetical protein